MAVAAVGSGLSSSDGCESSRAERDACYAWNKSDPAVKTLYFLLTDPAGLEWLEGLSGRRRVVELWSNWFIDAGSVNFIETKISGRFLSQDDRIAVADGLTAKESVKDIAGADRAKPVDGVPRDRPEQEARRHLPAMVRAQRGASPASASQAASICAGPRAPHSRRREAGGGMVAGPDQPLASTPLATPAGLACLPRDDLRGRLPRRHRGRRFPDSPHRPHLQAPSRSWSQPRWIAQAVHHPEADPCPTEGCRVAQPGRPLGDLIIGAGLQSAIGTLVERRTRFTVLVHLPDGRTAPVVGDRLVGMLEQLPPALRRTKTWDQGNEMFHHERIEAETGVGIYFADPHSPWPRGTNENTNGLLRQYFPKGTDLSRHGPEHLAAVALEPNNRPRACLGDRTPAQLMRRWMPHPLTI